MATTNSSCDVLCVWQHGTESADFVSAVLVGKDGAIVLAGYSTGTWGESNVGDEDFVVIKLDGEEGSELWRWQVQNPLGAEFGVWARLRVLFGRRKLSPLNILFLIPREPFRFVTERNSDSRLPAGIRQSSFGTPQHLLLHPYSTPTATKPTVSYFSAFDQEND